MAYTIGVIDPATEDVFEPQVDGEMLKESNQPDQFNEAVAEAVVVKKSKHKGPNKNSRLLCPQCGEVKQVATVENDIAVLSCGDSRTSELLPLVSGRVSIENLAARDAIGFVSFPVPRHDYGALRPDFEEFE